MHPSSLVARRRQRQTVTDRGPLPKATGQRRRRPCGLTPAIGPARESREVHHQMLASRTALRTSDVVIRAAIVALTLTTGYIHSTLGGLLFTLNALGYVVAALAVIVPLALAVRFRWVVRLGLVGYAATAIVMWAIQGPYYSTAYVAKAIEVALIVLLAIDFARHDGSPITVIRRELAALSSLVVRRGSAPAGA
jgi:hypothetical protein